MAWLHKNRPGVLHFVFNKEASPPYFAKQVDHECTDQQWNTYSLTQRVIENNTSRVKLSLKKDGVEIASHEMATSTANQLTNKQMKVYLSSTHENWPKSATNYNVKNFFLEQYEVKYITSSSFYPF